MVVPCACGVAGCRCFGGFWSTRCSIVVDDIFLSYGGVFLLFPGVLFMLVVWSR